MLALVRRELIVRYRRSLLGPAWAFIQPLVLTALFVMIYRFLGVKGEKVPHSLLICSALIPWSCFSNSIIAGTYSFISNSHIIKKIYCPREMFPAASVIVSVIDLFIPLLLYFPLAVYYHVPITSMVLYLPLLIVIQIFVSFGLVLLVSSAAVYGRDLVIGIPLIMQFWMLASPVMYQLNAVPARWRTIYIMNPVAGLVDSYRRILVFGTPPDIGMLSRVMLAGVILFLLGYAVFRKLEKNFADVM